MTPLDFKKYVKPPWIILDLSVNTWEHLPYIAVLKNVHRTATVCSSIRTFLRTVAVLWTFFKVHVHSLHTTANLSSFMDTFWTFCLTVRILHDTKLQTVAVLWTLFGVVT